jgi:hypothetical protein
LEPASAGAMAKREIRVKTKTIAINFFFIENPSFRLDFSDFTYIDEREGNLFTGTGIMEEWNGGTMSQQKIRKGKLFVLLPNIPVFQHSIIPGRLRAREGDDDRTFTTFWAPNRNTSPRGESYQGREKISSLSTYFHSYFSGYPMLIDQGEF